MQIKNAKDSKYWLGGKFVFLETEEEMEGEDGKARKR